MCLCMYVYVGACVHAMHVCVGVCVYAMYAYVGACVCAGIFASTFAVPPSFASIVPSSFCFLAHIEATEFLTLGQYVVRCPSFLFWPGWDSQA